MKKLKLLKTKERPFMKDEYLTAKVIREASSRTARTFRCFICFKLIEETKADCYIGQLEPKDICGDNCTDSIGEIAVHKKCYHWEKLRPDARELLQR